MPEPIILKYSRSGSLTQNFPKIIYHDIALPTIKIAISVGSTGGDATIGIRGGTISRDKCCNISSYNFFGEQIIISETSVPGVFSPPIMPFPHLEIDFIDVPEGCAVDLIITSGAIK